MAVPTIRVFVGNSTKVVEVPMPVMADLLMFSKSARRQPPSVSQVKFTTSDFWEPNTLGFHIVFAWLATTHTQNGQIQFRQLTPDVIQANQIFPFGPQNFKFAEALRVHEALLILDGDDILAHQTLIRQSIVSVVTNYVLTPVDFAMLVHIFRAPQSLDMALVELAFSKVLPQINSGQMLFTAASATYGTIIRSQLHHPALADIRKWLIFRIDAKITPTEFMATLGSLVHTDRTLSGHALRTLINKEVENSAASIELDLLAAGYPGAVAAIKKLRTAKKGLHVSEVGDQTMSLSTTQNSHFNQGLFLLAMY